MPSRPATPPALAALAQKANGFLNENPARRFAYVLLDGDETRAVLKGLPSALAASFGSFPPDAGSSLAIIDCESPRTFLMLADPGPNVLWAVDALGDVLGYVAHVTERDTGEGVLARIRQFPEAHADARRDPLSAQNLANKFLTTKEKLFAVVNV